MTAKKRGLGKGLDALLGAGSDTSSISSNQSNMLRILAIDLIERSKFQPRQNFNKDESNFLRPSHVIFPQVVVHDSLGLLDGEEEAPPI